VAQKFRFAILRIEVTRASRGLSAIAELLVFTKTSAQTDRHAHRNTSHPYHGRSNEQEIIKCRLHVTDIERVLLSKTSLYSVCSLTANERTSVVNARGSLTLKHAAYRSKPGMGSPTPAISG